MAEKGGSKEKKQLNYRLKKEQLKKKLKKEYYKKYPYMKNFNLIIGLGIIIICIGIVLLLIQAFLYGYQSLPIFPILFSYIGLILVINATIYLEMKKKSK